MALAVTLTEDPFRVVYDGVVAVAVGDGEEVPDVALVAELPPRAAGTEVASAPTVTWTCPVATDVLGVAVTPKSFAISAAFADAPVP